MCVALSKRKQLQIKQAKNDSKKKGRGKERRKYRIKQEHTQKKRKAEPYTTFAMCECAKKSICVPSKSAYIGNP